MEPGSTASSRSAAKPATRCLLWRNPSPYQLVVFGPRHRGRVAQPASRRRRLTFDVRALEGELAGADGPASVFVDIRRRRSDYKSDRYRNGRDAARPGEPVLKNRVMGE